MWAYDEGRGRRARDVPSSRPDYYYDDAYERAPPAPRPTRALYEEPEAQPSSRDRHRRKSIHADPDEPRSSRRNPHLVASDDEMDQPHGRSSREAYGSSYPERTSRHDVEAKTSDRDRHFRDKRSTYENGEAQNLRRAKSYSPRRAAREAEAGSSSRGVSPHAPRSGWPDDDYPQSSGHHRSSKKNRTPKQYHEEDPRAAYTTTQPSRSRTADRGSTGYDYPPSAAEMPRPPLGDQAGAPYKSSLASQAAPEERPSKHSRRREKDYYGNGYDDAPANGAVYDRGGYGSAAEEPPRRSHRSKRHDDDAPRRGDASYPSAQTQRGRHRSQPPQDDYDEDPYERVQQRPRHRQSMPAQARSRYPDDPYGDIYGQPQPPRRATSVNHGNPRRDQYYDDGYGRKGGSGSGGGATVKDKSGRKWQKQAGQLFMTHAVPVIKKEAVPFLTKAAQAYIEQQRRR